MAKEEFELEQERILNQHIEGENCKSLNIALVDAFTGEVVKYDPEASARVEFVVCRVDPDSDEGHDWTPQEFNLKIAKESKEKKPLLTGNVFLNLKEGIGSADAIYFAHRSGWMRCQFGLGARTVNNFEWTRVIKAKSEPFFLEDCHSKFWKLCYQFGCAENLENSTTPKMIDGYEYRTEESYKLCKSKIEKEE
ncbi:unnamed protein product [Camellia sinensis]